MAAAISCSARIAENGTKHIGQAESVGAVNGEYPGNLLLCALEDKSVKVANAPNSPAAASSCSDMEGDSDISFFKTALQNGAQSVCSHFITERPEFMGRRERGGWEAHTDQLGRWLEYPVRSASPGFGEPPGLVATSLGLNQVVRASPL